MIEHPKSFTAGLLLAGQLVSEEQFEAAEPLLKSLIELVPEDASTNGPRRLLSEIYRRQGKLDDERLVLEQHLLRTADDLTAILRLQEIRHQQGNAAEVISLGRLVLAVDPFQADALERMADAR